MLPLILFLGREKKKVAFVMKEEQMINMFLQGKHAHQQFRLVCSR